jgi:hypothetical protein
MRGMAGEGVAVKFVGTTFLIHVLAKEETLMSKIRLKFSILLCLPRKCI